MDVLDSIIRNGVTLEILADGPLHPVTLDDFRLARAGGLGDFHRVACGVHRRLSDFFHGIVVHRTDEAIQG